VDETARQLLKDWLDRISASIESLRASFASQQAESIERFLEIERRMSTAETQLAERAKAQKDLNDTMFDERTLVDRRRTWTTTIVLGIVSLVMTAATLTFTLHSCGALRK
jgi:hypothetical protein